MDSKQNWLSAMNTTKQFAWTTTITGFAGMVVFMVCMHRHHSIWWVFPIIFYSAFFGWGVAKLIGLPQAVGELLNVNLGDEE